MRRVQENIFLLNGFLLGSVGILYGMTFHYFFLVIVFIYACANWNVFIVNLKEAKGYLIVFGAYLLYLSLHTLIVTQNPEIYDKARYSIFENTLLNFILVPIYVATMRNWFSLAILKRFLFLFCLGNVMLNTYIAFDLLTKNSITDFNAAIEYLFTTRFGDNKMSLLGGSLLLEPQAFYIALTAFISYVMIFIEGRSGIKILYTIMFLLLLVFLSFTVTKAGLLAFLSGFVLINIYIVRRKLRRIRLALFVGVLLFVSGLFMFDGLNEKYKERADEIVLELENIKQGVYTGGTIAPRVGFIREAYLHVNEFAFWGLGVYAKDRIKYWLQNSDAELANYSNVHNTYLHYWIQGGILGLSLMLFLFGAPFYRMIKNKKFSYITTSIILIIFIANSTCILLDLNNSRLIIVLLLSIFYFYGDIFDHLEEAIAD